MSGTIEREAPTGVDVRFERVLGAAESFLGRGPPVARRKRPPPTRARVAIELDAEPVRWAEAAAGLAQQHRDGAVAGGGG